jgi:hypothetical protein
MKTRTTAYSTILRAAAMAGALVAAVAALGAPGKWL